jgi:hypothetical protein
MLQSLNVSGRKIVALRGKSKNGVSGCYRPGPVVMPHELFDYYSDLHGFDAWRSPTPIKRSHSKPLVE